VRFLPPAFRRVLLAAVDGGYVTLAYARSLAGNKGKTPDFLIIGAQRCGTTHLYDSLIRHPNVMGASHKEIHFFDEHYHRGARWYKANFPVPTPPPHNASPSVSISGEASATYIAHSSIPARVRELVPRVKLIALVRDPVDRAISHYYHFRRLGYESRSFEDAIDWEYDYLLAGNPSLMLDSPERKANPLSLSLGIYSRQIQEWLNVFEEDRLLLLVAEELFAHPYDVVSRVTRFLDLRDDVPRQLPLPKQFDYAPVADGTRRRLHELFAPHNGKLESLLAFSPPWD
jgi:hypothetical protein